MPWVRTAIAAAIGTPAGNALPPMAFQEEQDSMWKQIGMKMSYIFLFLVCSCMHAVIQVAFASYHVGTPLEGIPSAQWISFDRVLIVKDVLTGGGRVAKTADDAAAFRTNAFKLHNIENHIHASHTGTQAHLRPPKTITLLRKSRDRRILNEDEVIELLSRYGPVQTVEFTAETPVEKQLAIMASTGILISTHTSALANSVFLPPGAAVIEIIHRNWLWQGLDLSFKVHSAAAGDRHHWAWRATTPDQVFYINPRDKVRFGGDDWAGGKCDTDECVEAHTNVDVIVNLDEFGQLLEDVVPKVWGGVSVINAERPWPGHSTP